MWVWLLILSASWQKKNRGENVSSVLSLDFGGHEATLAGIVWSNVPDRIDAFGKRIGLHVQSLWSGVEIA